MRNRKSFEELDEKYKNRSVLTELDWCRNHVKSGYITTQDAEFYRWLFNKAYKIAKENA